MRVLLFAALSLLAWSSYGSNKYQDLVRYDLGLKYRIPVVENSYDVDGALTLLKQQRLENSYHFNKIIPAMTPVDRARTVESFQGKMVLYDLQGDGISDPLVGPPLECSEIRTRYENAVDLLNEIDDLVFEMEERLERLANGDIDTTLAEELALISEIATRIVSTWETMEQIYPASITTEPYRLEYQWSHAMNQSCTPRSLQLLPPVAREVSMPGLFWSATQGGSVTDFPNITHEPYAGQGIVRFSKEITLADACLNDQRVEIRARSQAVAQPGCNITASSDYILTAGVKNPGSDMSGYRSERYRQVSCRHLVEEYSDWLTNPGLSRWHGVRFQLTGNKIRSKSSSQLAPSHRHGMFSFGNLKRGSAGLVGKAKAFFSDRLTKQKYPFNQAKADSISINLNDNGSAHMILHTWGNTKLPFSGLRCFKDIHGDSIRATKREGNGTTTIHIGLHKYSSPILFLHPSLKLDLSQPLQVETNHD